jgi:CAI-1 autoinducer synthase
VLSNLALLPRLQERIDRDYWPRVKDQWHGKFILHGSSATPSSIHLDGNDYLSLTGHSHIVQAQSKCLNESSEQVVQSGVFLQDAHPSRDFEKKLAVYLRKDNGILCQSGYMANIGLLQAIADKETPVYVDSLAHASLWEGVHAARAVPQMFRHNDPDHLERQIKKGGAGVIIVDSVYSTTGALCPLIAMVELSERYGCMIVVDESHSLGTHGPQGAGLCAELDLSHRVHFVTTSLAKSFAGRAGFLTIPSELRNYVLTTSFPNIFSSGLLPYEIEGLSATLDVIKTSDEARVRLHSHTRRLRAALTSIGYPIHQGTEQIISLEAGTEPDTMFLRDRLEEHDVIGAIFCAPATSRNRAMVRLTVNAGLSDDDLSRIEAAAAKIAPIVKPWDWPIARRAKS